MNNTRRRRIRKLIAALMTRSHDWDDVKNELEDILSEEQEAMDNIPESLQDTERYVIAEESVDYLETASSLADVDPDDEEEAIQDVIDELIETLQSIDGV